MNDMWIVFALIGAVVSPMVAASKGRNALGWCALGFLMPMIAVIAICTPLRRATARNAELASAPERLTRSISLCGLLLHRLCLRWRRMDLDQLAWQRLGTQLRDQLLGG